MRDILICVSVVYGIIAFLSMLEFVYRWGSVLNEDKLKEVSNWNPLQEILIMCFFIVLGVIWPISWIIVLFREGTQKKI